MTGGLKCAVAVCKNNCKTSNQRLGKRILFHRFPKDREICQIWIERCGRTNKFNEKNARICSEHFTEEYDYRRDLQAELLNLPITKRLKPTAIPTEKLCDDQTTPPQKRRRKKPTETKTRRSSLNEVVNPVEEIIIEVESPTSLSPSNSLNVAVDPLQEISLEDHSMASLSPSNSRASSGTSHILMWLSYEDLEKNYEEVLKENEELKKQLQISDQQLEAYKTKISDLEKHLANLTSKYKLQNAQRA